MTAKTCNISDEQLRLLASVLKIASQMDRMTCSTATLYLSDRQRRELDLLSGCCEDALAGDSKTLYGFCL